MSIFVIIIILFVVAMMAAFAGFGYFIFVVGRRKMNGPKVSRKERSDALECFLSDAPDYEMIENVEISITTPIQISVMGSHQNARVYIHENGIFIVCIPFDIQLKYVTTQTRYLTTKLQGHLEEYIIEHDQIQILLGIYAIPPLQGVNRLTISLSFVDTKDLKTVQQVLDVYALDKKDVMKPDYEEEDPLE